MRSTGMSTTVNGITSIYCAESSKHFHDVVSHISARHQAWAAAAPSKDMPNRVTRTRSTRMNTVLDLNAGVKIIRFIGEP